MVKALTQSVPSKGTIEMTSNHAVNGTSASDLSGAQWFKARRSQGVSNCVEFAPLPSGQIAVRNSRHPDGPALIYSRTEIAAMVDGAKAGDFDGLAV